MLSTTFPFLTITLLAAVVSTVKPVASEKRVVGFYPWYHAYSDPALTPDMLNPTIYTHMKYAFIDIDADTSKCVVRDTYFNEEKLFPEDDSTCDCCARGGLHQMFRHKEENGHLSTMLAVGGWVWSKNFSVVATTPERRQTFVESCVAIMLDYGMDGIDVDWEFPVQYGQSDDMHRPDDADNLVALLKEFRRQLEDVASAQYLLTLDVHPNPVWYLDADKVSQLKGVLDWYNIMSYDFSIGGSVARHQSNLFANPADPSGSAALSTDGSVAWFLAQGVRPDEIVIGAAAYGRVNYGVRGGQEGGLYGQSDMELDMGEITMSDILKGLDDGSLTSHWDDVAKAPYASNAQGDFISYDSVESVAEKAKFVNEKGLSGIMVWNTYFDPSDAELSLAATAYKTLEDVKGTRRKVSPYEPRSRFCNIKEKRNISKQLQTLKEDASAAATIGLIVAVSFGVASCLAIGVVYLKRHGLFPFSSGPRANDEMGHA